MRIAGALNGYGGPPSFGFNTEFDNKSKISDFQNKLDHAKDLYATRPSPSQSPSIAVERPAGSDDKIRSELKDATSDLASLRREYVAIEESRSDPNGYKAHVEHQKNFNEIAEHFEQHADEALEDLRDPQTLIGNVREFGRDLKELGQAFIRSFPNDDAPNDAPYDYDPNTQDPDSVPNDYDPDYILNNPDLNSVPNDYAPDYDPNYSPAPIFPD